jgi:hypothetical protein
MDPEQTLKDARALAEAGEVDDALELYRALDEWVTRGGFLPAEWSAVSR